MKRILKINLFFLFLTIFSLRAAAQTYGNAVQYLDYIGKANEELTGKYLAYLSAVAHGKSARKVEKRRFEVVNAINETRINIQIMPPWQGDKSLRDTTVAYLKILNIVFNEDYGKIVNMEEIAEQSYDAMEAYLLAQEKAQEKLEAAGERQHAMQKTFAAKNDIKLLENESALGNKSKIVNEVMDHCNAVYLIFFKSYKQEGYLIDAMGKKNLVSIEQNLNTLQKFTEEGLEKLKKLKGYGNDATLIVAGRNALNFYKSEASQGTVMTDYFLKEESFAKLKKQFDAKQGSKRTQQDIDDFNKAVNDINSALKNFNTVNNSLNKQRSDMLENWNKTYNKYMDEYMPKQSRQ